MNPPLYGQNLADAAIIRLKSDHLTHGNRKLSSETGAGRVQHTIIVCKEQWK
jgi:hypothetical protein